MFLLFLFILSFFFFFSSRRRHTRSYGDWSSDVCSSDLSALSSYREVELPCLTCLIGRLCIPSQLGVPLTLSSPVSTLRPLLQLGQRHLHNKKQCRAV